MRSAPSSSAPKQVRPGDIPLEWEGEVVGGLRLPGMQGTLERMMTAVEHELGVRARRACRARRSSARCACSTTGARSRLRRSVESVADAMGVSRFTIYNYLNADRLTRLDVAGRLLTPVRGVRPT